MLNEMNCPNCDGRIRSEQPLTEGTTMACPFCKATFRLVAAGAGASSRADTPALPSRAPAPAGASSARRASSEAGGVPPTQRLRNAVAAALLLGVAGLVALFVSWYVGQVRALTKSVDRASTRRVESVVKKVTEPSAAKVANVTPLVVSPVVQRPFAPATMEIGDLVLGVTAVAVARVKIDHRESDKNYLVLSVRVTNRSRSPISYRGWQRAEAAVVLHDANRNFYDRVRFDDGKLPEGCVDAAALAPGETITDALVFEEPALPYRNLALDLPLDRDSAFRFTIPATMIVGASPPVKPIVPQGAVVRTPANAPAGSPVLAGAAPSGRAAPNPFAQPATTRSSLSPADSLARRRRIVAEYRELWGQVERRSKGMSYDRGRQFKRSKRAEVLDALAEKHQMTVDELRVILP